jgi:hypothetical protein
VAGYMIERHIESNFEQFFTARGLGEQQTSLLRLLEARGDMDGHDNVTPSSDIAFTSSVKEQQTLRGSQSGV